MNSQDHDQLRWQLQGLRRDIEPGADLWTGIAARLAEAPQQAEPEVSPRRRFAPWALAASLLLAVGFVWQLGQTPGAGVAQEDSLIRKHAVTMTMDYERELARVGEAQTQTHQEYHAALDDLDRSASLILSAIDREPNARFLLDQLRRTYARRLQLTQRALMT